MMYPQEFRYTKEHEWIKPEGSRGRVGITDHAQKELGDIVYVELPELGREVKQGEAFSSIESVKAVSDIYAPVSGKVIEVNEELEERPELINQSPHGEGWIALLEMADPKELESLMTAEEYEEFIAEASEGEREKGKE